MKSVTLTIILLFSSIILFGQKEKIGLIKKSIDENNFDECLEIISKTKFTDSTKNIVFYYKAICEREKKQSELAVNSLTIALNSTLKSDTLYERILFLRSLTYIDLEKVELAIKDNEILINQYPASMPYLLNMSYLYGENQQYYNCLKVLKKALAIDSNDVYVVNNLAYYNCLTKDYDAVIKYAIKGLKITTDSVWIATLLNSLGLAQAKIISSEIGLKTLDESIAYKSDNPYSYYNKALVYIDLYDKDNACKNLRKAKELGGIKLTYYLLQECE